MGCSIIDPVYQNGQEWLAPVITIATGFYRLARAWVSRIIESCLWFKMQHNEAPAATCAPNRCEPRRRVPTQPIGPSKELLPLPSSANYTSRTAKAARNIIRERIRVFQGTLYLGVKLDFVSDY